MPFTTKKTHPKFSGVFVLIVFQKKLAPLQFACCKTQIAVPSQKRKRKNTRSASVFSGIVSSFHKDTSVLAKLPASTKQKVVKHLLQSLYLPLVLLQLACSKTSKIKKINLFRGWFSVWKFTFNKVSKKKSRKPSFAHLPSKNFRRNTQPYIYIFEQISPPPRLRRNCLR